MADKTTVREARLIPIKEFSSITGIPVSTLRYYDDMGLLRPAERAESGYRHYAPQQIVTVKFIRVLIDCGLPLKTIGAIARDREPESLLRLLQDQALALDRETERIRENRAVLGIFMRLITEGLLAREDEIEVKHMPALPLTLGIENRFESGDLLFYHAYVRFLLETPDINTSFPVGGLFTDMSSWLATPSEPCRFFSIDPRGRNERAAGLYLVGCTRGYYGNTGDLPERMNNYAKKHGLAFAGPVYNIFLQDEVSNKDPNRYLMQASVLVQAPASFFKT